MIVPLSRLALLLSVYAPSLAHATFILNYASWKELEPATQEAYLIGVIDDWTGMTSPGEPGWMNAERVGVTKCMAAQGFRSAMLLDLVNSHYKTYTADWRLSPALVVKEVLVATCLHDINSELKKAGLSTWKRKPAQISPDN